MITPLQKWGVILALLGCAAEEPPTARLEPPVGRYSAEYVPGNAWVPEVAWMGWVDPNGGIGGCYVDTISRVDRYTVVGHGYCDEYARSPYDRSEISFEVSAVDDTGEEFTGYLTIYSHWVYDQEVEVTYRRIHE